MKIGIVGTREVAEATKDIVRHYVRRLRYVYGDKLEIVSGGARGVDATAQEEAELLGIKVTVFTPKYFDHGRLAPLIRNDEIVEHCDMLVAFWDGESKGTKYTIRRAQHRNKPVELINIPVFQGDESVLQTDDPGSSPGTGTNPCRPFYHDDGCPASRNKPRWADDNCICKSKQHTN